LVYHVLNRGNGRQALFDADTDYLLFQRILWQAQRRLPMRLIGYCLMPNHWHLLLWPHGDGDLSEFMRWLTVTHTQRWHAIHGTAGAGHLYQGRFKSFPVQVRRPSASQREQGALELGSPVLSVLRYVERNPVRARLATRAELWSWGSAAQRGKPPCDDGPTLSSPPCGLPADWNHRVNRPHSEAELAAMQRSLARGAPFGDEPWVRQMASDCGLESTLRPRGRPPRKRGQEPFSTVERL
jgi:putative transposase